MYSLAPRLAASALALGTAFFTLAAPAGIVSAAAVSSSNLPSKMQPLRVKIGLWETTITNKIAGELPIPAETMNRLSPEQRARMMERLKGGSTKTTTTTNRSCVHQEDLADPNFVDREQCNWTTLESDGMHAKGSAVCQFGEGMQLSGNGEIIVVDQEHTKGTIHLTSTGSEHTMTTDSSFTSRWLGTDCGNEK
jgi:hypothetical protein